MKFYEIILIILASALAIRFSLKFDLNRYLEERRKIKIDQLKNICPHGRVIDVLENKITFQSLFSSPNGTLKWVCSQCGCVLDSEEDVNIVNDKYQKNPSLIFKKQMEFVKQAKKLKIA